MKIAIASVITAVAVADKASIDRQLIGQVQNGSLRTFSGNYQATFVERLDEYGCWCYFNDNVGRGKGTPVDEIDGFCKTLADGYQCAIIDGESEGNSCVPWEVSYSPGAGQGPELFQSCQTQNPSDNCAARACSVEGIFVDNLFTFLISGTTIAYDTYGHNDSDFDPATDAGCPVKTGIKVVSEEKSCCGG